MLSGSAQAVSDGVVSRGEISDHFEVELGRGPVRGIADFFEALYCLSEKGLAAIGILQSVA